MPPPWVRVLALLAWAVAAVSSGSAQQDSAEDLGRSLEKDVPALSARLIGLEHAQGVLVGALIDGRGNADESDVLRRMTRRLSSAAGASSDPEAERGFDALGDDAAAIVRRAYAFHREVVAVFAGVPPADRKRAVDAAVRRYKSRPGLALPDAPKDMTILYDHPYTSFVPPRAGETEPRRELAYPALTGFVWSAHWYQLAVLAALESSDPAERDRDLARVADRFTRKLTAGTPPDGFPTELPLAPAIAPGLTLVHERAASIVDNLNMMLDVLTDVLVHPGVTDRQAAVNEVMAQFTNREYRCVQAEEWMVVALRHSIFAQGGPALGTMTEYERNGFSGTHGQHYGPRRAPPACDAE
jgi:hypothetical protein